MTLHATRSGKDITIHGNTGVSLSIENSQLQRVGITEHYEHIRYFHGQLGRLISEAEADAEAKAQGSAQE